MAKKLTRAQQLKNPATRSKIPTSQLPAKYQKMRKANATKAAAPPVDPLDTQARASADVAYGDAEQQLGAQQVQSAQIQQQVPQYFADYMNSLNRATDVTKQAYAGAAAISQNAVNSTSALDTQQQAAQGQQMAQQSAIQGSAPSAANAQLAQQASMSRRAAGDAQTGLIGGLGAAQVAYRGGQQVVGAQQQLKASGDEAARGRGIAAKRVSLAKEKGQYVVTTKQKLEDAAHTADLENKAFGLNVQKANDDVTLKTAALTVKQQSDQLQHGDRQASLQTRQQVAAADRASREREGHLTRLTRKATASTIASSGVTPAEKRRRNTAVNQAEQTRTKAVGSAREYAKHGIKSADTLRTALQEDYPSAPKEAIDYALAAALGSKAKVTKKGQPTAADRYRKYLRRLATGDLAR